MVNFTLIYKPYTISRESEHYWTMYKNMCVFKRVLAAKTTNSDAKTTTAHTVDKGSAMAIANPMTTILVTIFTYLIVQYERCKLMLKVSTAAIRA